MKNLSIRPGANICDPSRGQTLILAPTFRKRSSYPPASLHEIAPTPQKQKLQENQTRRAC